MSTSMGGHGQICPSLEPPLSLLVVHHMLFVTFSFSANALWRFFSSADRLPLLGYILYLDDEASFRKSSANVKHVLFVILFSFVCIYIYVYISYAIFSICSFVTILYWALFLISRFL